MHELTPLPTPEDTNEAMLALSQANALLDDVLGYLQRLPPVPVTREFIERIVAARTEPAGNYLRRRAELARRKAVRLEWSTWMGNGEPVVFIALEDETLRVTSQGLAKRPKAAQRLVDLIDKGLKAKLAPQPR